MREVVDDQVAPVLGGHRLRHPPGVLGCRLRAHALELLPQDADADVGRRLVLLDPSRGARPEPDVDLVVDHHHPHQEPVLALARRDRAQLDRVRAGVRVRRPLRRRRRGGEERREEQGGEETSLRHARPIIGRTAAGQAAPPALTPARVLR